MTTDLARRIFAFTHIRKMSLARLAEQLDCTETEAGYDKLLAQGVCDLADTKNAIAALDEIAERNFTTVNELVAMFT